MGSAQAHCEAPALARADRERVPASVRRELPVPGQRDVPRYAALGGLDVEIEPDAALDGLRQACDDARDHHVASIQIRIEAVGKPALRQHRGPDHADRGERDEEGRPAGHRREAASQARGNPGKGTKRGEHAPRRELGQLLKHTNARREADRGKSHGMLARTFIRPVTGDGLTR